MGTRLSYSKIGISTNLLNDPSDVFGAVASLSERFPVVEIELENGARDILAAGENHYQEVVGKLARLRLDREVEFSVHAPYLGPACDLSSGDETIRKASSDLLHRAIQFCVDIGGQRVTYHPGFVDKTTSTEKLLENLRCSLDELVPIAVEKGIKLCLENTGADRPRYVKFSAEQYAGLAEQTGTCLTLDLIHHGSLHSDRGRIGQEFYTLLEVMVPHVENVHLADANLPQHVHLPMGMGCFPAEELLDYFGDRSYRGNVIIEEMGGGYSSQQFLARSRKFRDRYCKIETPNEAVQEYARLVLISGCFEQARKVKAGARHFIASDRKTIVFQYLHDIFFVV